MEGRRPTKENTGQTAASQIQSWENASAELRRVRGAATRIPSVRKDHPLRPIRAVVDQVLKDLSPEFAKMYSKVGRLSVPPEQLQRALPLRGRTGDLRPYPDHRAPYTP